MADPPKKPTKRRARAAAAPLAPVRGPDTRPSRQAKLFHDPMPDRVEPCLATLVPAPPPGDFWLYEVKWDGYRLHVHVEPGGVHILTRGGHDWSHRFPSIVASAAGLTAGTALLDGEAVVLDDEGRSDFPALQQALGGRGGKRIAPEVLFYAFDCLYLDGRDLRSEPLDTRRAALAELLAGSDPSGWIRRSEEVDADGRQFLAIACEMGLEGIIAKDRRKPYRSGRGKDWLKIKCIESESFAIVGYEPSESALGKLGRLMLAAYQGERLVYVGGVGTGFTAASATALRKQLDALRRDKSPIALRRKGVIWTEPTLVAEIEFRGWTDDGKLRHPSFKGLRDVADEARVYKHQIPGLGT